MSDMIKLGLVPEPFQVDLWGTVFDAVPPTRSVLAKLDPLEDKLLEDPDPDGQVDAICAVLDVRLRPVEGTKKPSTLVKAKWKADDVTLVQLYGLLQQISEQTARPL